MQNWTNWIRSTKIFKKRWFKERSVWLLHTNLDLINVPPSR